jgi:hypothetical protein
LEEPNERKKERKKELRREKSKKRKKNDLFSHSGSQTKKECPSLTLSSPFTIMAYPSPLPPVRLLRSLPYLFFLPPSIIDVYTSYRDKE